jgi:hypothetical protein
MQSEKCKMQNGGERPFESGFVPGDGESEWSNLAWWEKLHKELRTPRKDTQLRIADLDGERRLGSVSQRMVVAGEQG